MYIKYRKDQKLQEASIVGFAAVIGTILITSIIVISSIDNVSGIFEVLANKKPSNGILNLHWANNIIYSSKFMCCYSY